MNDCTTALLTFSTRNVSLDGANVCSGARSGPADVGESDALAALRAFAALPAVELVDVEAKIYLTGPQSKVAVQNIGGRLFVTPVPEAVNIAVESTPEETLARLLAGDPGVPPVSGDTAWSIDAEAAAVARRNSRGWRGAMNSVGMLAVLLAIAATMAFFSFKAAAHEGVELVRDPVKIAGLHARLNGRYGSPGATVLALASGKLTGWQSVSAGGEEKRFGMDYRLGQRGDQVVLVLSNGALLELQPSGGLRFLDSAYPRQAN